MATFRPPKRRAKKKTKPTKAKRSQAKQPKPRKPKRKLTYLQTLRKQAREEKEEQLRRRKKHQAEVKKQFRKIKLERDPSTGRFLKANTKPKKQSHRKVSKALDSGGIPLPSRAAKLKRADARKGEMNRYQWRFEGYEGIDLAQSLMIRLHENAGRTRNPHLKARIGVNAGEVSFSVAYKVPLRALDDFEKLLKAYEQRLQETGIENFEVLVHAISYMKLDFM